MEDDKDHASGGKNATEDSSQKEPSAEHDKGIIDATEDSTVKETSINSVSGGQDTEDGTVKETDVSCGQDTEDGTVKETDVSGGQDATDDDSTQKETAVDHTNGGKDASEDSTAKEIEVNHATGGDHATEDNTEKEAEVNSGSVAVDATEDNIEKEAEVNHATGGDHATEDNTEKEAEVNSVSVGEKVIEDSTVKETAADHTSDRNSTVKETGVDHATGGEDNTEDDTLKETTGDHVSDKEEVTEDSTVTETAANSVSTGNDTTEDVPLKAAAANSLDATEDSTLKETVANTHDHVSGGKDATEDDTAKETAVEHANDRDNATEDDTLKETTGDHVSDKEEVTEDSTVTETAANSVSTGNDTTEDVPLKAAAANSLDATEDSTLKETVANTHDHVSGGKDATEDDTAKETAVEHANDRDNATEDSTAQETDGDHASDGEDATEESTVKEPAVDDASGQEDASEDSILKQTAVDHNKDRRDATEDSTVKETAVVDASGGDNDKGAEIFEKKNHTLHPLAGPNVSKRALSQLKQVLSNVMLKKKQTDDTSTVAPEDKNNSDGTEQEQEPNDDTSAVAPEGKNNNSDDAEQEQEPNDESQTDITPTLNPSTPNLVISSQLKQVLSNVMLKKKQTDDASAVAPEVKNNSDDAEQEQEPNDDASAVAPEDKNNSDGTEQEQEPNDETDITPTLSPSTPNLVISSPFQQTSEEFNALDSKSDSVEKASAGENKSDVCSADDNTNNSAGDSKRIKSPEKGHVYIGFSSRKNKYKCFLCDEVSNAPSFEEHVMLHILWKPYKCLYCPVNSFFMTRSDIGKHVAEAHPGQSPKCGLRAIKKAKDIMKQAQKCGTYLYVNQSLNDMYWACKGSKESKETKDTSPSETGSGCAVDDAEASGDGGKSESIQPRSHGCAVDDAEASGDGGKSESIQPRSHECADAEASADGGKSESIQPRSHGCTEANGDGGKSESIQPRSHDFVSKSSLCQVQVSPVVTVQCPIILSPPNTSVNPAPAMIAGNSPGRNQHSPRVLQKIHPLNVQTVQTMPFPNTQVQSVANSTPPTMTLNPVSTGLCIIPTVMPVVTLNSGQQLVTTPVQQQQPVGTSGSNNPVLVLSPVLPTPVNLPQPTRGCQPIPNHSMNTTTCPPFVNSYTPIRAKPVQQMVSSAVPLASKDSHLIAALTSSPLRKVVNQTAVPPVITANISVPPVITANTSVPPVITANTSVPGCDKVVTAQKHHNESPIKSVVLPQVTNTSVKGFDKPRTSEVVTAQLETNNHDNGSGGVPSTQQKDCVKDSTRSQTNAQTQSILPMETNNPITQSVPSEPEKVQVLKRLKFTIGMFNDEYLCCLCKQRFKLENNFRAHLWFHLHPDSRGCDQCLANVTKDGLKLLACTKTEEYVKWLQDNQIGCSSHCQLVGYAIQDQTSVKSKPSTSPKNPAQETQVKPVSQETQVKPVSQETQVQPVSQEMQVKPVSHTPTKSASVTSAESVNNISSTSAKSTSAESHSNIPSTANNKESKWKFFVCGSGCGYSSLYGSELKKHIGQCNESGSLLCFHCQFLSDSPESLLRHLSKHSVAHAPGIAHHTCAVKTCKFSTNILQAFENHMITHHPTLKSFDCLNCKETFENLHSLMHHLYANILNVVTCKYCPAKDLVRRVIQKHISDIHPEKPCFATVMKQSICKERKDNSFGKKGKTQSVPKDVSAKEKPEESVHECSLCNYMGIDANELSTHIEKHSNRFSTSEMAFSCPKCPETFNYLRTFDVHLRKHDTPIRYDVFSCVICKAHFGRSSEVEKHIQHIHRDVIGDGQEFIKVEQHVSNSQVESCSTCSYKCLGKDNMQRHSKSFHNIDLKSKETTSASSDATQTDNCDKGPRTETCASLPERIQVRMAIPAGDVYIKPVKCIKCTSSFVYHKNLTRHMSQSHPEVVLVVGSQEKVQPPLSSQNVDNPDGDSLKVGGRLLDNELEWLFENHVSSFKCLMCSKEYQRKNMMHLHILDIHLSTFLWKCSLCSYKTSQRNKATDHVESNHENHNGDILVSLLDEIRFKVKNILGEIVTTNKDQEIKPLIGSQEIDVDLRNKYKVIGKKKICKQCNVEHQSLYNIHKHIIRRHLNKFMYGCGHCNHSAVDRYSVVKHLNEKHSGLEKVVKYFPNVYKTDKHSKEKKHRRKKTEKEKNKEAKKVMNSESNGDRRSSHSEVHHKDLKTKSSENNGKKDSAPFCRSQSDGSSSHSDVQHKDLTEKNGKKDSAPVSGRRYSHIHPNQCEYRNELRAGSDKLDQKLKELYDVKAGRDKVLVCRSCQSEHISKYNLHLHLLGHLKADLVGCPYCTFKSIENVSIAKHIETSHPGKKNDIVFLSVDIEEAVRIFKVKGGIKSKTPVKSASPLKLSKNVVCITEKGLKKYKCKLCGYVALTKTSVESHLVNTHKTPKKKEMKEPFKIKLGLKKPGQKRKRVIPDELDSDTDASLPEFGVDTVDKSKTKDTGPKSPNHKIHSKDIQPSNGTGINGLPPIKKQKIDNSVKSFNCPKCKFKTASRDAGVNHLKKQHGMTQCLQCIHPSCAAKYEREDKLVSHVKFFHKGSPLDSLSLPLDSWLIVNPLTSPPSASRKVEQTSDSIGGEKKSPKKPMAKKSTCPVKPKKSPTKSRLSLKKGNVEKGNSGTVNTSRNVDENKDKHKKSDHGTPVERTKLISEPRTEFANEKITPVERTEVISDPRTEFGTEKATPVEKTKVISDGRTELANENTTPVARTKVISDQSTELTTEKATPVDSRKDVSEQKTDATPVEGTEIRSESSTEGISVLHQYVTDSPDNSEDEEIEYYPYLCVYCNSFKGRKKSELKLHLADHLITRLHKGIPPESNDDIKKIKKRVSDIIPFCKERGKNIKEKIVQEEENNERTEDPPVEVKQTQEPIQTQNQQVVTEENTTMTSEKEKIPDKPPSLDMNNITARGISSNENSPIKITTTKRKSSNKISSTSSSESDSDEEIDIGKKRKFKRIRRVVSSSEEESDSEASCPPKKTSSMTYCCNQCNFKVMSLHKFRSHLASHGTFKYLDKDLSSGTSLACGFCNFIAENDALFSQHVDCHFKGRKYKCGYCKYDSFHHHSTRSHLKMKHRHKPEKIIDLSPMFNERARRPFSYSYLVNLDPQLKIVNALSNPNIFQTLLEEANCETLDLPQSVVDIMVGDSLVEDVYDDDVDDEEEEDKPMVKCEPEEFEESLESPMELNIQDGVICLD